MTAYFLPQSRRFIDVVDGVSRRLHKQRWSDLTSAQLHQIAEALTSSVSTAMRYAFWPESRVILEITTVNNTVPWAEIDYAVHWKVYDAEPATPNAHANEVEVKAMSAGLRLTRRTLATVWVVFCPRPAIFNDIVPFVSGGPYINGDRAYNVDSSFLNDGEYYRAYERIQDNPDVVLGGQPDFWKELVILDCIAEAVKLLALSDLLGNGEQERAQAADLRQQAEDRLGSAWIRTVSDAL